MKSKIIVSSVITFLLATIVVADTGYIYEHNLYFGLNNNQDVAQLQRDLGQDPSIYPEKIVTAYFGQLTLRAVKRFQAKYGIMQTGYVGPLTRAKLNELYPRISATGQGIFGKVFETGCGTVMVGGTCNSTDTADPNVNIIIYPTTINRCPEFPAGVIGPPTSAVAGAVTDANGDYKIYLKPGVYKVCLPSLSLMSNNPITVTSNNFTEVNFQIPRP